MNISVCCWSPLDLTSLYMKSPSHLLWTGPVISCLLHRRDCPQSVISYNFVGCWTFHARRKTILSFSVSTEQSHRRLHLKVERYRPLHRLRCNATHLKWKHDNNIRLLYNCWLCWCFVWQIPVGRNSVCRGGLKCSLVESDQSPARQPQSPILKLDVHHCGYLEINLTDAACAVIDSGPFMSIIIIAAVICLAGFTHNAPLPV